MSQGNVPRSEPIRRLDVPEGTIFYVLRRKRVKNLNLRLGPDGVVRMSIPWQMASARAEEFLHEKSGWVFSRLKKAEEIPADLLPQPAREECARLLMEALARVYPLVEPLGVAPPQLKLRKMKSQWGNCHWAQGYITLNTALGRCPEQLRDYVALHELVHFLHHDHGPGFYEKMDTLMPDWRERRKTLKRYAAALEPEPQGTP